MLKKLIKKYIGWMLLSYIFVIATVYTFVFNRQKDMIEQHRKEKTEMEYKYMKLTSSPAFLASIENAIAAAETTVDNFLWVEGGDVDPSLTFYNYISRTADKANMTLLDFSYVESRATRGTERASTYHTWRVGLSGHFQDMLEMVNEIERASHFVIINEISAVPGREPGAATLYNLTLLCLKKGAGK